MSQFEEKYQDNKAEKPSWIQRFFILCSGVDKKILFQCRTEWNKYSGIGATIFFTGLLASLSGGYALYAVFRGDDNAITYAIIFGIIWGFVILNLDRFIVSSIRKEGNIQKELLQATPRFILALIISIVIAKPLEVRIFESRIDQQILELKQKKLIEEKEHIDELYDLSKLATTIQNQNIEIAKLDSLSQTNPNTHEYRILLEDKKNANQDYENISRTNNPKISDFNNRINLLRNNSANYIEQKDSLGTVINRILIPQANKTLNDLIYSRDQLRTEINVRRKRIDDIETKIEQANEKYLSDIALRKVELKEENEQTKKNKTDADDRAAIQREESEKIKERSYSNNFITQLEALGNLTDSNNTMALTSWMIMLLFIVIETAPILVKLLSKRGPYDEILDRVEYEHFINEKELISRWNSKINEYLEKARESSKLEGDTFMKVEKQRLDYELKNNQKILNDLAQKQEHLAKLAIEKWYQNELKKFGERQTYLTETKPRPLLEGNFWRQLGTLENIEYYFRNGAISDNEILLIENEQVTKGKWNFISSNKDEINIELPNNSGEYHIKELSDNRLILQNKMTNELIEMING